MIPKAMAHQSPPSFQGFQEDAATAIRLPKAFFTQLLPQMNDLHQLRLLLYMFWHSEGQQSKVRYFRLNDLSTDPALVKMVGGQESLGKALQGLVDLGAVLAADMDWMDEVYYFINSPQGRAAVQAIKKGEWQDFHKDQQPIHLVDEEPNIFELYEENIGVITPMMADILKDDEATYPATWIREAIRIAVARNVRTWKYVQAILKRWQKEGFANEQNRRDDSQDPESYRKSWLQRE
jgi:DnaD/phage-associated family protein